MYLHAGGVLPFRAGSDLSEGVRGVSAGLISSRLT